jgi:hypothetical protein
VSATRPRSREVEWRSGASAPWGSPPAAGMERPVAHVTVDQVRIVCYYLGRAPRIHTREQSDPVAVPAGEVSVLVVAGCRE